MQLNIPYTCKNCKLNLNTKDDAWIFKGGMYVEVSCRVVTGCSTRSFDYHLFGFTYFLNNDDSNVAF